MTAHLGSTYLPTRISVNLKTYRLFSNTILHSHILSFQAKSGDQLSTPTRELSEEVGSRQILLKPSCLEIAHLYISSYKFSPNEVWLKKKPSRKVKPLKAIFEFYRNFQVDIDFSIFVQIHVGGDFQQFVKNRKINLISWKFLWRRS